MERTLVLIKPDGVQRGLIGEIIKRFEQRGFKIAGMKLMQASRDLAERHYAEHQGKPFYEGLVGFITSAPLVALVLEGKNAVAAARHTMGGQTNPLNASTGGIRGDFALDLGRNLVHGSDGVESAEREIALWFRPEEIVTWERAVDRWIYE